MLTMQIQANDFSQTTRAFVLLLKSHRCSAAFKWRPSKIHKWSKALLVPSRTESIIFSSKIKKVNHPPIQMNRKPIKSAQNHWHLGVTISENVKWDTYIYNSAKSLSVWKEYICFISSILDYPDVTWDHSLNM
jgi:hypothetical protein